jgi:acetylornithine/succinyldiaminopimelate/putrescine aminotransferase
MRLLPPLVTSDDEAEEMIRRIVKSVHEYLQQ